MRRPNFALFIRLLLALSLCVLAVMVGGIIKPEAAVQPVSFAPKMDFATSGGPLAVAVGDFNGDGKLDLAAANSGGASTKVSILLGTGTGSFGPNTDFVNGH